jgi:hypothetical protein
MRRARITTSYADSETAAAVANAVRPDNTTSMETTTEGARVITTIARDSTGGLHATVDDYVVNLTVAAETYAQDGDSSTQNTQS